MSNCPINDLLKYIENKMENGAAAIPEKLNDHILNCDTCKAILTKPYLWKHFIDINKQNAQVTSKNQVVNENEKIAQGQIRLIALEDGSDATMALITDISTIDTYNTVRVSPITVSPIDEEIDSTDIILEPSQTPTGLTSLVQWWNDRPVLVDNIKKNFGNISHENFNKIVARINNPIFPTNLTKSLLFFRESEKIKGNRISASFFEKHLDTVETESSIQNNKIESQNLLNRGVLIVFNKPSENSLPYMPEPTSLNTRIYEPYKNILGSDYNYIPDSFVIYASNECLPVAAASKDIYEKLSSFLKKQVNEEKYYLVRSDDSTPAFTIINKNGKPFNLMVTKKESTEPQTYSSNKNGKLYLKNGLDCINDFDELESLLIIELESK